MTARRADALWAGWGGTVLFLACWLMISRMSAFSFLLWVGLMSLGAVMCFYGGVCRSKWFFLPWFRCGDSHSWRSCRRLSWRLGPRLPRLAMK